MVLIPQAYTVVREPASLLPHANVEEFAPPANTSSRTPTGAGYQTSRFGSFGEYQYFSRRHEFACLGAVAAAWIVLF
jgi:hypothetical protein